MTVGVFKSTCIFLDLSRRSVLVELNVEGQLIALMVFVEGLNIGFEQLR